MWKGFKEIFTYTRKQRNGLVTLVMLALLLQVFLYFNDFFTVADPRDFSEFKSYARSWQKEDSLARIAASAQSSKLFYFDPNTASDSAFQALGFSSRLSSTIINYRSKGGQFREASDLQKIYGMDSSLYERVSPYVSIASAEKKAETGKSLFNFRNFDLNKVTQNELEGMGLYEWQAERIINFREKVRPFQQPEELHKVYDLDSGLVEKMLAHAYVDSSALPENSDPAEEVPVIVDINSADSLQLLELSGVGPFYAKMIRQYRDRLGGFYNKEQLLEVYGMDQERLNLFEDELVFDKESIQKLNVNTAGFKDLLRHPYLEFEVVKNIANFREDVRPFRSVDELRNLELIDEQLFSKIAKYLTTAESGRDRTRTRK